MKFSMRMAAFGLRAFTLCLCLTTLTQNSFSQSFNSEIGKFEVGASIGPLMFLGDLGGNPGKGKDFLKDVNLPVARMAKGIALNFYPVEWVGLRIAFNQGRLEGADSLVKDRGGDELSRKERNLHFRSQLIEGYAGLELYPTAIFEGLGGLQHKLRPYGIIGVGLFHFNPQAQYKDHNGEPRWVDLQPLHTEGQGMAEYPDRTDYKLTQVEIPVGGGIKYYLKDNMYVGFEIMHRRTNTDYIDDVSTDYIDQSLFDKYLSPEQAAIAHQVNVRSFDAQSRPNTSETRGNTANNDSFFSTVVRFGWRLKSTERSPRSLRCPQF
jgi:hypothetical protein